MKFLFTVFSILLTCMTFVGTAHADVIDPGNPYRRPPRPAGEPLTRVYRMRKPDFSLTKAKEKQDAYVLRVTLPGPCKWEYNVFAAVDGTTREVGRGGAYSVQDFNKDSDSREIGLKIPEGKDKAEFLINVQFCLYRFVETSFGPKVYGTDRRAVALEGVYELSTVDGKTVLNKL